MRFWFRLHGMQVIGSALRIRSHVGGRPRWGSAGATSASSSRFVLPSLADLADWASVEMVDGGQHFFRYTRRLVVPQSVGQQHCLCFNTTTFILGMAGWFLCTVLGQPPSRRQPEQSIHWCRFHSPLEPARRRQTTVRLASFPPALMGRLPVLGVIVYASRNLLAWL